MKTETQNKPTDEITVAKTLDKAVTRGPGSRLRDARLASNYSIEEVARKLYLTTTLIKAIEEDDYHASPGLTFVRGYLRSYAKLLKIPGDEVMDSFDSLGLAEKPTVLPTSEIFFKSTSVPLLEKGLPWITGLIILFFILLVFMWWRSHNDDAVTSTTTAKSTQSQPQVSVTTNADTTKPMAFTNLTANSMDLAKTPATKTAKVTAPMVNKKVSKQAKKPREQRRKRHVEMQTPF